MAKRGYFSTSITIPTEAHKIVLKNAKKNCRSFSAEMTYQVIQTAKRLKAEAEQGDEA